MNFIRLFKTAIAICLLFVGTVLLNCDAADSKEGHSGTVDSDEFSEYWYAGQAELTRYELQQARYGEIRKGDAVLIFVTEDFLADKQVKYEFGDRNNAVPILKLNFTRKFYTGIYPYSMMSSIFTPVSADKPSLKVTTTVQEWCGHVFIQLNQRNGKYNVQLRSYFQAENDQDFMLDDALLEDEIWTRIRLAPDSLPTGDIELIPGGQFARLRHTPLKVEMATAKLTTTGDTQPSGNDINVYTISYKDIRRTLSIEFEKSFPHRILAW